MLITIHGFEGHVLGMDHQAGIISNYLIVLRLRYQFVSLGYFMLRNELLANVGRPKASRSLAMTTKSLFKLAGMNHVFQSLGSAFAEKLDLELSLCIDQWTQRFVKLPLTPANVHIEATE